MATDFPLRITFDSDATTVTTNDTLAVVSGSLTTSCGPYTTISTGASYSTISTNGPYTVTSPAWTSPAWVTTAILPLSQFTTTFTPGTLSYDEMINLVPNHPFQAGDDGACWHCHSQGAHRNDMMSHIPIIIEEEPTLEEWCDLLVA